MSLKFAEVEKPAGITAFPASLKRPAFGALYGFDAPQEEVSNIYNIEDRETETVILASSPINPSGQATVKFGSDTYDLYVWDGSAWYFYREDFSSPIFDGQLTFPDIQVFDTEAEFITQTDAPQHTIVHAKDTDKLYVWNSNEWVLYNNN